MVAKGRTAIGSCVAAAIVAIGMASAADDTWQHGESPIVGGNGRVPWVGYIGPRDNGFDLVVECHGPGPSVYITVKKPGPDLRQLRFDTPIPVVVRLERGPHGKATAIDEARVVAALSEGYLAHTDRIRVGIGLQDGAAVADLLGRDIGSEAARAVVEIAKSSALFRMDGAHKAFAQFRRSCDVGRR